MAMTGLLTDRDREHLQRAIELARDAGSRGNLPIGCVIGLDDRIVAEGQNWIWAPTLALHRHAEMEALRALPVELADRCRDMTLYTTLEPCLMCAGAIMLHSIGRVVFGAADAYGGLGVSAERLPPFFAEQYAQARWIGPAGSEECEQLYERVMRLVTDFPDETGG
jgi:tRNA(adenine34) deaminase